MKTIGLLGGMTCESSSEYYRIINEATRKKLGGIHSARSVMVSVDISEIEPLMEAGKWETILAILVEAAQNVEKADAHFLVICTNTMHKLADEIQKQIQIPILNIIDATAEQIKAGGLHTVGLLGTRFTMEEDFYKERLSQRHGLKVLVLPRRRYKRFTVSFLMNYPSEKSRNLPGKYTGRLSIGWQTMGPRV